MDKRTFGQVLNANMTHHGNRIAIIDGAASWTYAEFGARVFKLANILDELGLKRGDRFAIQAKNGRAFEELRWAGYVSGIVPVAINWRLAPPEIKHVLEDSSSKIIFIDEEFVAVYDSAELDQWQAGLQPIGPGLEAQIEQASTAETNPGVSPDDDALLLYTGGTTGRSKGVRLSHWNIISCGLAFGLGVGARPDGVFLHVAPMFHSADLLSTGWFLTAGAHCYMPAFSPAGFLEIVQDSKVSATVTVPAMLMAIVSGAGGANVTDFNLSSLKTLIFGASPMSFEWTERVAKAFPDAGFLNCYGLTETSPDLTIFNAAEFRAAIESGERDGIVNSVGKPNMLVDLRVVGSDGQDVAPGEVGELWARGPNIMQGYLNLPEETAAALTDGWLHTGDMARIDEQGFVYLLDRLKDLVITGGENVYSSEVEAALHRHPAVSEAAIIGIPDEKLGEALFAVIVLRPEEEVSDEDLIAHCRDLIGGYKIPRQYAFVEALPKSALGKVLKAELRAAYG